MDFLLGIIYALIGGMSPIVTIAIVLIIRRERLKRRLVDLENIINWGGVGSNEKELEEKQSIEKDLSERWEETFLKVFSGR